MRLPRGIWYEAAKRRYRVRKYHNRVCYLEGYYRNLDAAKEALGKLETYLATIPKKRRGNVSEKPVSGPSVAQTAAAIRIRHNKDSNNRGREN